MTRILTDGAEFGDTLIWSTGTVSASSAQARSGTYSYMASDAILPIPSALSEFYIRFGWRFDSGSNAVFFRWRNSTTILGALKLNSLLKIEAYTGDAATLLATGATTISLNTWYLIEVHVKIADSLGDVEVKVDGITPLEIDFSGDTKPSTQTTVDNFRFTRISTNTWIDDIAINNTGGASDNSWCEDGHVVLLNPDDNGDVTTWSGSDGDSVNNYLLVDEIPSDGDTTYVESVTISGEDLYNFEASALTGTTIRRVWIESRTKNTVAAGGQVAHVIKTNGTEYVGSGISLLTSYARCVGEEYVQNPNTAAAWTVANLDALQAGPLVKSTG